MAFYSVHLRGNGPFAVADAVFIRQGFAWRAFFLGPIWLLERRLWLAGALWIAAAFALATLAGLGVLSLAAAWMIALLLEILLGLEANQLFEGELAGRGYDLVEIIASPELEQAETAFFRQMNAAEGDAASTFGPRSTRPGAASVQDVVGVFPEPGARR